MLTGDLIARIRRIEITTRKLVSDSFAGEYQSVFKGRGMEFDEVRQYHPGDDVRSIDWNVTARTGEPYVKSYIEERELTVMLAVDVSGSGDFGTRNRFKRELAGELAAVMSFAATTNNDKVGLLLFTDRVELLVPPRKGRSHVLRMVRDLLVFQPVGSGHGHPACAGYGPSDAQAAQHCVPGLGLPGRPGVVPAGHAGNQPATRCRGLRPERPVGIRNG